MSESCIDCPEGSKRPTSRPGPRCATHQRERKKASKVTAHDSYVQRVYGLGPGDYERLYGFQGGVCAICRRARGISRKLAVDHDHSTGLVRMLACSTCNKLLGHFRDDPNLLRSAANALENPPARQLGIVAYHQDVRNDGRD